MVALLDHGKAVGYQGLFAAYDRADEHAAAQPEFAERDADAARPLAHVEFQRLDFPAGELVQRLDAAPVGGVRDRAHEAHDLLGDDLLGGDHAVPLAVEHAGEVAHIDLDHGLGHAAALGVHGGDDVVAVVAGERDEGVGAADALLEQHLVVRGVAADHARVRDEIAQLVAAIARTVEHRDGDPALVEQVGQIHARAAAAHDHHVADARPLPSDGGEKAPDLLAVAQKAELVAAAQRKIAVGDRGLLAALDDGDEHLRVKAARHLAQAQALERAFLRHAVVEDLDAALGKGLDADRAGEAQDARDLLGALVLGVDDDRQADRLAQEFRLRQILRVADARDDVLRAEAPRGQRADHVHLVALRHGHEDVGALGAGLAQGVGVRRAAEAADHVQFVGGVLDRFGVAVDERDVVALGLQALGEDEADAARAGDDDLHTVNTFLEKG